MNSFTYKIALNETEFSHAKNLFMEYASSLKINLDFQHFSDELNSIAQMYAQPDGLLLLVYDGISAIACAAYRKKGEGICELKRMYVQPQYRKHKIGKELLKQLIEKAALKGYSLMRLDTLQSMTPALNLYRENGFYDIPAYYENPNEGVVYMEKRL